MATGSCLPPRKVNFSATISRSVWIMIRRYWAKCRSSVTVCPEYKYVSLGVLVWLKCCRKTVSVIFRLGEQEEYLFPVFPSPRNREYLMRRNIANPELVYQFPLNKVSTFPDLLCGGSSTATLTVFSLLNQHKGIESFN